MDLKKQWIKMMKMQWIQMMKKQWIKTCRDFMWFSVFRVFFLLNVEEKTSDCPELCPSMWSLLHFFSILFEDLKPNVRPIYYDT